MNDFNKLLAIGMMLGAGAVLSTWSSHTHARTYDNERSKIYFGASYGGYKARGGSLDDDNDYFEANLGARVNSFLGIEASWLNFGEYGTEFANVTLDGYAFSVVGYLPLASTVDIFAKAGMFYSNMEINIGGLDSDTDDDQLFFSAGAALAISDPLQFTLEYSRYKVDHGNSSSSSTMSGYLPETDIDTVKVGLRYTFN